ncbi:MAG: hypothetical protein HYS86_01150 [Candidatus Chisholmbacteria bacterium]|nr:hypothetical protein [Candidatus Chisholmbacteria bacterium]
MKVVKLVVTVPKTHADKVRQALGRAGAGHLGKYSFCSFTLTGTGRFLPQKGAKPAIGKVGQLEKIIEERIEVTCYQGDLDKIIAAVKKVHPYEEPAIDVYPLLLQERRKSRL